MGSSVNAREDSAPGKHGEAGIGVANRNVDADVRCLAVVASPFDRHPMRSSADCEPGQARCPCWADVLELEEAAPHDGAAIDDVRTQAIGHSSRSFVRIDQRVDEQPAPDSSVDGPETDS